MDKLDLNKLEAKDGILTVVTRVDKALEVHNDKPVSISGSISSPGNYYEGRIEQLKDVIKKSHVVYDYTELFIKLVAVENNDINAVIRGELIESPEIDTLKINTGEKLTVKDLYNLLRMNKFYFVDKAQCQAICEKLQTTKTTVEKNVETELNKGDGKQRNVYDIAVRGIDPIAFDLKLPIYVGQEPTELRVDVNIDARSGDVLFWMESMDLEELKKSEAKRIMDIEMKRFKESGLVLIEQCGQSDEE